LPILSFEVTVPYFGSNLSEAEATVAAAIDDERRAAIGRRRALEASAERAGPARKSENKACRLGKATSDFLLRRSQRFGRKQAKSLAFGRRDAQMPQGLGELHGVSFVCQVASNPQETWGSRRLWAWQGCGD